MQGRRQALASRPPACTASKPLACSAAVPTCGAGRGGGFRSAGHRLPSAEGGGRGGLGVALWSAAIPLVSFGRLLPWRPIGRMPYFMLAALMFLNHRWDGSDYVLGFLVSFLGGPTNQGIRRTRRHTPYRRIGHRRAGHTLLT